MYRHWFCQIIYLLYEILEDTRKGVRRSSEGILYVFLWTLFVELATLVYIDNNRKTLKDLIFLRQSDGFLEISAVIITFMKTNVNGREIAQLQYGAYAL